MNILERPVLDHCVAFAVIRGLPALREHLVTDNLALAHDRRWTRHESNFVVGARPREFALDNPKLEQTHTLTLPQTPS